MRTRPSRIPLIAIVLGICSSALVSWRNLVGIDGLLAGCSNSEDNDLVLSNNEKGSELPLRTKAE